VIPCVPVYDVSTPSPTSLTRISYLPENVITIRRRWISLRCHEISRHRTFKLEDTAPMPTLFPIWHYKFIVWSYFINFNDSSVVCRSFITFGCYALKDSNQQFFVESAILVVCVIIINVMLLTYIIIFSLTNDISRKM